MRNPAKREQLAIRATEVKARFAVQNIAQQWKDLFNALGVIAVKPNKAGQLRTPSKKD
jgi:hypothetical protein